MLINMNIIAQKLPEQVGNQIQLNRFQSILNEIYKQHPETNGISVFLLSQKHHCLWYGAVGNANSNKEPLSVNHPVNIASVTKIYVAAAIMRLIEQGEFTIQTPVLNLISDSSKQALHQANYNLNKIQIKHLLSNTSGIFDFVNTTIFQQKTTQQPTYQWTMQEQIKLAATAGNKRFEPGEQFEYSETNYLLLAEIISLCTQQHYHVAVKKLLQFNALGLQNTWFIYQEQKPGNLLPLAEQTAKSLQVNSLSLNPSFDAFGGGGLASTVHDMAVFGAALFEGKVFKKETTLELMCSIGLNNNPFDYAMGLAITKVNNHIAYGHGGFWGTQLKYIPALGLSVGVYVLERDSWPVYNLLIDRLSEELVKN